mgnify:FL=1
MKPYNLIPKIIQMLEIDNDLMVSNSVIGGIQKRIIKNKLVLYLLFFFLLVAAGIILYFTVINK